MIDGLISVIIPTYKRPEMLAQAITSVKKQNYDCVEIIVIDDYSNDTTTNVIAQLPDVQYYKNETNRGPGYSRKFALENSRGEFVVFLDDDDYYTDSSFYSNAVSKLLEHKEYVFVSGNAKLLYADSDKCEDSKLNVSGEMDSVEYLSGFPFKYKKPLSTFTTVFRKSALVDAGIQKMRMVNDMAIYMRCLTSGKVFFLEDYIGVYRIHASNISKSISVDFIIENLLEKYYIYNLVKETDAFEAPDKWWIKQIEVTVSYFVFDSHPKLAALSKVKKWCLANSSQQDKIKILFKGYQEYLKDLKIHYIKTYVKKVLGIK